MPETGTLVRARSIFDASMQVLRANWILMIFNVIGLAFVVLAATAVFGVSGLKDFVEADPPIGLRLVLFYLVMMFLSTFTNVAFVHEAMMALNGNPVSVRRGFAVALKRIKAILLWSLFAGIVGVLLMKLEQKLNFLGKMGLKLVGLAWSVASIFAIPIMIREETSNPIQLLKKSSTTLKKKWGETISGYVGLNMGMSLVLSGLIVGGIILGVILVVAGMVPEPESHNRALLLGGAAAFLLLAAVFAGTVDLIFKCALYIYATEDVIPTPYDAELMDAAWKVKKQ